MKYLLIAGVCLLSLTSQAVEMIQMNTEGDWGSGGGNGLVCFRDSVSGEPDAGVSGADFARAVARNKFIIEDELLQYISSIEMYDLYEAKKRRGIYSTKPEIIQIGESEDFYEYFSRLSTRFHKRVDAVKELVVDAQKLVPDSQILFHSAAVKNQNDLGNVTLPEKKCVIVTMAAQVNYHDHYQVHIDERLFFHPKHSKQSQATLILHELLYAMGRKNFSHKDSGATRSLIRYLISYHPSITEGHVAASIVDLKFANNHLGAYVNFHPTRYARSYVMSNVLNDFVHSYQRLARVFSNNYLELMPEFKVLNNEINNLLVNENVTNPYSYYPSEIRSSIFVLKEALLLGFNYGVQTNKWGVLKKRFDEQEFLFRELIIELIETEKRRSTEYYKRELPSLTTKDIDGINLYTDMRYTFFRKSAEALSSDHVQQFGLAVSQIYDLVVGSGSIEAAGIFLNDLDSIRCVYSTDGTLYCPELLPLDNIIPKS